MASPVAQSRYARPAWVEKILQAEWAQKLIREATPIESSVLNPILPDGLAIAASGVRFFDELPPEIRFPEPDGATKARGRAYQSALGYAMKLVQRNRPGEAYEYLQSVFQERSDLEGMRSDPCYLDLCLLLERYDEAGLVILPLVKKGGFVSEENYLRLSVLSASKGKVFESQMQYCRDYIEQNCSDRKLSALIPQHLPVSSREMLVESCLALGTKLKFWYDEMALSIDSKNQLAAQRLMSAYVSKKRYCDARRIADIALETLPPEPVRLELSRRLKQIQGREDALLPTLVKPNLNAEPPPRG